MFEESINNNNNVLYNFIINISLLYISKISIFNKLISIINSIPFNKMLIFIKS